MKKILMLSILIIAFCGCTDKDATIKALKQQGYSSIETKGYGFLGCSKGDTFATEFKAISNAGYKVEGVFCSGWFKGGTIRTY